MIPAGSMWAVSVLQPRAALVAIGASHVLSTAWGVASPTGGLLAIHATSVYPPFARLEAETEPVAGLLREAGLHEGTLRRGAVVAIAQLVTCGRITAHQFLEQGPGIRAAIPDLARERRLTDLTPGRFAWILRDVLPLNPPIPARGGRGLWRWSPSDASLWNSTAAACPPPGEP